MLSHLAVLRVNTHLTSLSLLYLYFSVFAPYAMWAKKEKRVSSCICLGGVGVLSSVQVAPILLLLFETYCGCESVLERLMGFIWTELFLLRDGV